MTIQKFTKQFKDLHIIAYSTDKSKFFARDANYKAYYIYDQQDDKNPMIMHKLTKCNTNYQNWFKGKLDLSYFLGCGVDDFDKVWQDNVNFTPCSIDYDEGTEEWTITNDNEIIIQEGFKTKGEARKYADTHKYRELEKTNN